jgi:hypothetical protein
MIFPVVLGTAGREPIYAGYEKTSFELIGSRILDSRIALLEYRPSKQNEQVSVPLQHAKSR